MQHALVQTIKGIGAARAAQLNKLGIFTAEDLLSHLPREYHDLTRCSTVEQMHTGQVWFGLLTLSENARLNYIRRGFTIVRVRAGDDSGTIVLVFYNQPYYKNSLLSGKRYYVYGTPVYSGGEVRLVNPMMEAEESSEGLRLLPVYRLTAGLSQSALRKCMRQCLAQFGDTITDALPRPIREKYGLMSLRDAYEFAHFPVNEGICRSAVDSLAFTELLQLRLYLKNKRLQRTKAQPLQLTNVQRQTFLKRLGFPLTGAQERAISQIAEDMQKNEPMSRLLQGDVGCGKTVVAFYALYTAVACGMQGAMMAPTELLAQQHYQSGQRLFESLGITTACLRSGMKASERAEVLRGIADKSIRVVFGTHALLSQGVEFGNPGVIVVDEQHRFGVRQRAQLLGKAECHALFLSATPIPRTLAMIVYGDLDISVIDEMPPNRKPVKTHIVLPNKQDDMIEFLAKRIEQGRQGYIVCPQIEPQEMGVLHSAEELFEQLRSDERLKAGLMHGRMKMADRDNVMQRFQNAQIGVLISTTVVEVGVDVPNATIMIVQNAERFGLAQLHQLRGRVGRGNEQSFCFLCTEDAQNVRLQALCSTQDGFVIAQKDLEQRGPGEFLGEQQHGRADVRISGMLRDAKLLDRVVQAYDWLYEQLPSYVPQLLEQAAQRYENALENIALN